MITQMGEVQGSIADLTTKAGFDKNYNDATPRDAAAVEPHPTIPSVSSPEPAASFGGNSLRPVTSTAGNTQVRGDLGGAATVDAGGPAPIVGGDALNSGRQPNAYPSLTPAPIVGDLVTGGPRDGIKTQDDNTKVNGNLVTGKSTGGYVEGVNVPGPRAQRV